MLGSIFNWFELLGEGDLPQYNLYNKSKTNRTNTASGLLLILSQLYSYIAAFVIAIICIKYIIKLSVMPFGMPIVL